MYCSQIVNAKAKKNYNRDTLVYSYKRNCIRVIALVFVRVLCILCTLMTLSQFSFYRLSKTGNVSQRYGYEGKQMQIDDASESILKF